MRYDVFIIWGNGLQYTEDILSIIRNDSNFDIIFGKWFYITNDIGDFIRQIYSCDAHPWSHLELKTQYLLTAEKKIFFILVRNYEPDEFNVEGDCPHIECNKVKNLKLKLRNKFNPRSTDKRELGLPLDEGVSHRHVIHATDYEGQVDHLLKVINMENLDYYKRYDKNEYSIPFHLNVSNFNIKTINIDETRIDIINEGLQLPQNTPYYKYLNGNKNQYINYFKTYSGTILIEDHSPEKFQILNDNFNINYINRLNQKCLPIVKKEYNYYRVLDGGHRIAIMKYKNINNIEVIEI